MFRVLLCLQFLVGVSSYPWFQQEIPNGNQVPHPCLPDQVWDGVGHKNQLGGGDRNPFGMAFNAAGRKWTKALCEADTDGDGNTNGYELGDPDCTWSKGETPKESAKGHPGVCEPIDSDHCMEKNTDTWNICGQKVFDCPAIQEDGVKEVDLQFPRTAVPNTETNYFCQMFRLPDEADYHIAADKPILDNRNVIHHMILYACTPGADIDLLVSEFSTPAKCGMLAQSICSRVIGAWTVGGVGACYSGIDAGTRIGKTSYRYAILEVHWNNPELRTDWQDGSGMKLYYTEKLRTYDLGVLTVGQMGLKIPPNMKSHEAKSRCSSSCTKKELNEPLYIVSAGLHMHYAGSKGYLDLYRNNEHVKTLAADEPYRYDSPVDHEHSPAVEILPGDELETTCIFSTTNRPKHVYYGDATSDEMCFAFITYYPIIDFNYCFHFGETELCDVDQAPQINGCRTGGFEDEELWEALITLNYTCDNTGKQCLQECKDLLTNDPPSCLSEDARMYNEYICSTFDEGKQIILASRSCDEQLYQESLVSSGELVVLSNLVLWFVVTVNYLFM